MWGTILNNVSAFLEPQHSFNYSPSLYGGKAKWVWVEGFFYFGVFRYLFKIILLHFIKQHASKWREYRNRWQQPNAYSNINNEMCEHGVERSDTGFTFIFLQQHTCMKVRVKKVWSLDVWCAGISKIIFLNSWNKITHFITLRHFMEERAMRVWVEGFFDRCVFDIS